MNTPGLSLIIPVYNSAPFIQDSLKKIQDWSVRSLTPVEVIIVNDGSADESERLIKEFQAGWSACELITFSVNQGKGFSLRQGLAKARGDYIAFTDADLPYGLNIMNEMQAVMHSDPKLALVFGSRHHPSSTSSRGYGLLRSLGRLFFSKVVQLLAIPGVADTQCGIKMMTRSLAGIMVGKGRINRFAFDVELFGIARANSLSIRDFPVELTHRKESSVHLVKDTLQMLKDIIYIRYNLLRGYYRNDLFNKPINQ
jgi:glycosyltransferase involved in cell wall biosynthesis